MKNLEIIVSPIIGIENFLEDPIKGFLLTSQYSKPVLLFTMIKTDRLTPKPLVIVVICLNDLNSQY